MRKLKGVKVLRIDRSRWLQDTAEIDRDGSGLLKWVPDSEDENCGSYKMCCLGFLARKQGFTAEEIRDEGLPSDIDEYPTVSADRQIFFNAAARVNDSPVSRAVKERQLKALFKEEGIKLIFEGREK